MPESKSSVDWIDHDTLIVSRAILPDDRTDSGYARRVVLWKRGQDLSDARILFEAPRTVVATYAYVSNDHGIQTVLIGSSIDYDRQDTYLLKDDLSLAQVHLPSGSSASAVSKSRIFFETKKPWREFETGVLLVAPISSLTNPSVEDPSVTIPDLQVVFRPSEHASLAQVYATNEQVYVTLSENVRGQLYTAVFQSAHKNWKLEAVFKNSANSFIIVSGDHSHNQLLVQEEGYLQPKRIQLVAEDGAREVKRAKSFFDEKKFASEQLWATSKDGTQIPYTVIKSNETKMDGSNPTLLYGYGGFEISLLPTYNGATGSLWLEKGGVFVVANIRGGGEFGPNWHRSAILENKQRSYDDFIAVAEDLIARKITSPKRLGVQGGSNGGLLVGAVTMQRPELFNAVVCQIPLLDMIRYTELPPGASWADEYGDPKDPKMREVILKYSPYQNISKTTSYPKMFFQTTQADDRVHPGHARKMVARMKEFGHEVLLFESQDGGHGGGGVKPEDQARSAANIYTYLYQQLMPLTETKLSSSSLSPSR
ncbi:MAG: S9 family peptidase [Proteobacteria bacterium]|nr:MAG: S9 family peptidase [Pseudomonadota bacterium]